MRGALDRRLLVVVAIGATPLVAACGSSHSTASSTALQVLTTKTPGSPVPATTTTPRKPPARRAGQRGSPGAHHAAAPAVKAAPLTATAPAPRFAVRVSAACRLAHPPRPPRTAADVAPAAARHAATQLAHLVARLALLRPPRVVQSSYVDMQQSLARLETLYRFAAAGRMTVRQVRAQLLPGIRTTHSHAADVALLLGATGCSAKLHDAR